MSHIAPRVAPLDYRHRQGQTGREIMAWKKPNAVEIACGMEINMYGPSEDDERRGDVI